MLCDVDTASCALTLCPPSLLLALLGGRAAHHACARPPRASFSHPLAYLLSLALAIGCAGAALYVEPRLWSGEIKSPSWPPGRAGLVAASLWLLTCALPLRRTEGSPAFVSTHSLHNADGFSSRPWLLLITPLTSDCFSSHVRSLFVTTLIAPHHTL